MAVLIITLIFFRKKVKNLYEYILIGAAVGIGFTIVEDIIYADGQVVTIVFRLIMVAGHMTLNMIMAEFLGRARFNTIYKEGPRGIYYILAFLIPVGIHTLYDMGTAFNKPVFSGDTVTGAFLAAAGILIMVVAQFYVLIKFKMHAEKYCAIDFVTPNH